MAGLHARFPCNGQNNEVHIHAGMIALLSLTRRGLKPVTSYCHKDLLSVNYTEWKEPLLAGIL